LIRASAAAALTVHQRRWRRRP